MAVDVAGRTNPGASLVISPDLAGIDLAVAVSAAARVAGNVHINWTDFGNLLMCPSGTLSGTFDLAVTLDQPSIHAGLTWSGGGDKALHGVASLGKVRVQAVASEPPIRTLARQNPGLLTCAAGQLVTGLAVLAAPQLTEDLLASGLRKLLGDNNNVAAALIDGQFLREDEVAPFEFDLPAAEIGLAGGTLTAFPKLTPAALSYAVASQ